jgi:hypothetical protein
MSWRNTPPKRSNYETEEEYDEAIDSYYDALEAEYESRRMED